MAIDTLKRLAVFVVLVLAQALVFNHIRLFGYATPLLYVYFTVIIPRGYPKWATLLWSFALGLCVDLFTNTPGVAAGSMTLVGLLQPYMLELFIPREAAANMKVSAVEMGWAKFATLTALLMLVYCLVFFSLLMFTFIDLLVWGFSVLGSLLLTMVLLMALESVRKS